MTLSRSILIAAALVLLAAFPAMASCPAAPTLLQPTDGSEKPFGLVLLEWTDVGAEEYDIVGGLDGDNPTPFVTLPGTQTSKEIPVEPGRSVEWFIRARTSACPAGTDSASSTFTTTCPTDPPNPFTPADNASFAEGTKVTFAWSHVSGSSGYDLKVSDDGGDTWDVIAENLPNDAPPHTFTAELGPGSYIWEVRASFNSSACVPLFSAPRTFVVVTDTCSSNEAPALVDPDDGETEDLPVRFRWTASTNATQYRLFLKRDTDQTARLLATTTEAEFQAAQIEPGQYQWFVITSFDGCPDLTSDRRQLIIEGESSCPDVPGKATLLAPAAGANNLSSPVTFRWNAVAGAKGYRVLASFNGGEPVALGATTNTSLTENVPAGVWNWGVQTLFGEDCATTLSDTRMFTVTNGAACTTTPPQLTSPANGATGVASPVTFAWTAVQNATNYRLFVAAGDDDEFEFYGETEATSLNRLVPSGEVRWFVVAEFAACPVVRSATSVFFAGSTPACPDASIALQSPADDATVTSPVTVSWSAVANATAYRVWVSSDDKSPINVARVISTSTTLNLPAGRIRWYVEALRENCRPVISEERTFTVTEGAGCAANTAPVLVEPLGTADAPAARLEVVPFLWLAVDRAIGYRVWVAEIDEGEAFEDVALTKEPRAEVELEPGLHAWYVEALFEGCSSRESAVAYFRVAEGTPRCPVEAPVPIAPAPDESVTAPVTFSWNGVAGAEKYRVFAATDDREAELIGTTSDTQLTRTLPPDTYFWLVEAAFDDCSSTRSTPQRFTVPRSLTCNGTGAAPVSPAQGATVDTSPIEFVWSAVSGALRYVLVLKANDGAPTAVASTTLTHAMSPVPHGEIEWWVVTFFAGCDPIESPHFRFGSVRGEGCDNDRPLIILPGDSREQVNSPVEFQWTRVADATGYRVWARQDDAEPAIIAATVEPLAVVDMAQGEWEFFVEATFATCQSTRSAVGEFKVVPPPACGRPGKPAAKVVGRALSGTTYNLRWTPLPNVGRYEVQESTTADFAAPQTFNVTGSSLAASHEVTSGAVRYFYRVRGISECNDQVGPYSDATAVVVVAPQTNSGTAEAGSVAPIVQQLRLPGESDPYSFTVTSDDPAFIVTPSSGTVPTGGLTLFVSADPGALALGTNTATIHVERPSAASDGPRSEAGTVSTIPMSVSLVTPVLPTGKGTPPPDSLVFPVVGHAQGVNDSLFESDIRVTNLAAQTMRYQLNFTPSGVDGTVTGSSSTIEIAPNGTLALDDIVANLFGSGTTTGVTGMLEVRPLTTTSSSTSSLLSPAAATLLKQLTTVASSRTYNFTPAGTFGQFIPATRFGDFLGKAAAGAAPTILSLQQVAQSSAYRANFGFAEASGKPVDLAVRVYDTASRLLTTIPVSLKAGEHRQENNLLSRNGITNLSDGRVEVEVVNGDGKITAYVSTVDNRTNDPLLVSAVPKGATLASRYVVPGVAYLQNDSAFWVTDLRVYNSAAQATPATLTFYPSGNPAAAVTREITLDAGEIEVLDNVIGGLFAQPNGAGGMILVATPADSALTATARTYNQTSAGTYGQYIPGVTPAESAALGDRALQLLQLEQSSRFRTNVGVAETSGKPATVELSVVIPDSLVTPVVSIPLAANEFRQISLAQFGLTEALYNGRVTVKVVSGEGRVTAYGSAIDAVTQDPTYVPAQ